jgi:hypothetical protein
MSDLVLVGLWYENGRTAIKPGTMLTGATSGASGRVVEVRGEVLFLKGVTGDFVYHERLVGSCGAHGISRELNALERLAAET